MARADDKIEGLIQFLEMFQDKPHLTDEGISTFKEIHNSENYQCEMKIVANLVFCQDYSLSGKFAKVIYEYECNYHLTKLDCVHLCIMTHLVTILK